MKSALSRRTLMKMAAVGSAVVVPSVADAVTIGELPIDRVKALTGELGDVMNEYLDGRFFARVYPSNHTECNIDFERIDRSLNDQLDLCVAQLKAILARMHPDCELPTVDDKTSIAGTRSICISAVMGGYFDGDGLYEVELNHGREIHVCDVRQRWSDMDQRHYLYTALIIDGYPVGPREIVYERQLVRKLEG